jgi:hypothetical protein
VTTEPDLARYDDGCIRVTNPMEPFSSSAPSAALDPDALLALARRAVDDPSAPIVRQCFGHVSVCDRSSIRNRFAWVIELAGKVVVVDDETGKVLLTRKHHETLRFARRLGI